MNVKHLLVAAGLACVAAAAPARDTQVGVSVSISQPGVYGRIDIGRFPQPQVVVAQPVIVHRPVRMVRAPEPVYMWVPPGHRKNWRKHCGRYGACGVPVYFVRDQWYDHNVKPHRYERERGERRWDDRRDDGPRRDHDRGRGRGGRD